MRSPRYTTPPVTEHQPSSWLHLEHRRHGAVGDPALVVDLACPRSRSTRSWCPARCRPGGSRSPRSAFWPTSPIQRSSVARSNENRHGLRSPIAQISGCGRRRPTSGSMRSSLPSGIVGVLGVVVGVAAAAAVAQTEPQQPVGAEHHVAAVVVGERLVHREQLAPAPGVGPVAVHRVRVDPGVAVAVRVAGEERVAVLGEGDAEQAPLAVGGRLVRQVEHRVVAEAAAPVVADLEGPDGPPRSAT